MYDDIEREKRLGCPQTYCYAAAADTQNLVFPKVDVLYLYLICSLILVFVQFCFLPFFFFFNEVKIKVFL